MEKTIFVIDDNNTDLLLVEEMLGVHYNIITMASPKRMFTVLENGTLRPDLILLDVLIPEMNGFDVLRLLKSSSAYNSIPVIFLTSSMDLLTDDKSFEMGVVDIIFKPFSSSILLNRVKLHIEMGQYILSQTAQLTNAQRDVIYVLSTMVEYRDKYTGGHIERTAKNISILMEEMIRRGIYAEKQKSWDMSTVHILALLHDIGKIGISDSILNKPGYFTPEERLIMQDHARIGEEIIDRVKEKIGDNLFLENARGSVGYHHENWDGSGYPYGLKGEYIPLQGRIMAFVDVYDALITERPYKKPFTHDAAIDVIMKDVGKKFDPKISEAFWAVKDCFV